MVKTLFEENDIICGTEKWRDRRDPDILSWDDKFCEHSYLAKRHTKTGRSSGGTSLFIKNDTSAFGITECQNSYHVWYKLDKKTFPTINKSIYICFLYIPPSSSRWFQSGYSFNFEKLMQDVAKYESMGGEIFIMGDLNARIGKENDFIKNNDLNAQDDYLPIPDDFKVNTNIRKRNTLDNTEVYGHHTQLLDFCKATGLEILNGRVGDGNFTCHIPAGSSTVDYCLT